MTTEPTPAEILARFRNAYATCRSYQDTGVVTTVFLHDEPIPRRRTTKRPFSTAFVRPDRFRFEWAEAAVGPESEWKRMLILWNGDGLRSSWTIEPGIRDHESLHSAIGGATGVSGGSAYTVPTLLIPGGKGRDPLAAEDGLLRGCERLGECECFVLESPGRAKTLWIGRDDFLIRRIDKSHRFDDAWRERERQSFEEALRSSTTPEQRAVWQQALERVSKPWKPFRLDETTTYEPVVDEEIEPDRFETPDAWPRQDAKAAVPREGIVLSAAPADAPSAPAILARVRSAYRSCVTLRDAGTETSVHVPPGPQGTQKAVFSLEFLRPDRFRLEIAKVTVGPEDEWERSLALWNEEGIREHWPHLPGGLRSRSPGEDLLGSFGPNLGVPALLVPCPPDRDPLPAAESAELLGLATLAGRECFVVRGVCANGAQRTFWIDRERALVRRCDEVFFFDEAWRRKMRARLEEDLRGANTPDEHAATERALEHFSKRMEPYRTETTLLFEPELDVVIPAERFATPEAWRES